MKMPLHPGWLRRATNASFHPGVSSSSSSVYSRSNHSIRLRWSSFSAGWCSVVVTSFFLSVDLGLLVLVLWLELLDFSAIVELDLFWTLRASGTTKPELDVRLRERFSGCWSTWTAVFAFRVGGPCSCWAPCNSCHARRCRSPSSLPSEIFCVSAELLGQKLLCSYIGSASYYSVHTRPD